MDEPYGRLASVYDWLVPEAMLEPEGAVAAFDTVLDGVPAGAPVLDCACGTGQLAVGLALRGYAVTATDASAAMIDRARELAARRAATLDAHVTPWEKLPGRGWEERFELVLCVGNSLTHAPGRTARRAALDAMAAVLRPGGRLAVTSRDWERVRARGDRLDVDEAIVERHGARGLVVRAWRMGGDWDEPHSMEVKVALPRAGSDDVRTIGERLTFWPFTHAALLEDLAAAGLAPALDTFEAGGDRYLVVAQKPASRR